MPAVQINGRTYEEVAVTAREGFPLSVFSGLEIPAHDYISLGYTGTDLTSLTYKLGGSGGTTVASLSLTYDVSGNLTSVTKS